MDQIGRAISAELQHWSYPMFIYQESKMGKLKNSRSWYTFVDKAGNNIDDKACKWISRAEWKNLKKLYLCKVYFR